MDSFKNRSVGLDSPGRNDGALITKSDTEPCDPRPRFCLITGTGTLRAEITPDQPEDFNADEVAAMNGWAPLGFYKVHSTGTDASIRIRGFH